MSSAARWVLTASAIAGASGVAIGAFGAHGLPDFLESQYADPDLIERRIAQFETGARYHLLHAVALFCLAAFASMTESRHGEAPQGGGASQDRGPRSLFLTAILFVVGILFFSGSLYLLVLTNTPWLGAITPIGGLSWIIAWILVAFLRPVAKSTSMQ